MNWIHTLTNHFADELGMTNGIDKHCKADRGGSLQERALLLFSLDKVDYTEETLDKGKKILLYIFVTLFLQGHKCHSYRILFKKLNI